MASALIKKFGQRQKAGWTADRESEEFDPTAGSSAQTMFPIAVRRMGEKVSAGGSTSEVKQEPASSEPNQVIVLALMEGCKNQGSSKHEKAVRRLKKLRNRSELEPEATVGQHLTDGLEKLGDEDGDAFGW